MCLRKIYAKFQPDQDATSKFRFKLPELFFCQIKISILQNTPAHLILVLQIKLNKQIVEFLSTCYRDEGCI